MKPIALAGLFGLHFVCVIQCLDIDLLSKQATYVDAKVGSYAVFNCPLGKQKHTYWQSCHSFDRPSSSPFRT